MRLSQSSGYGFVEAVSRKNHFRQTPEALTLTRLNDRLLRLSRPEGSLLGNMPTISVLLPVMNEVASLNQTLDILISENPGRSFEFLIVLSERSEPTAVENAYRIRDASPSTVRVIVQERPLLGGALMDAIDAASGEYILMMASDLETDPHAVHEMLRASDSRPQAIIATTRWKGEGAGFEGYGLGKQLANSAFQQAVRAIFASDLTDLTYGFRLYPRASLTSYEWKTLNHGFLLESILRPLRDGWNATELPVTWRAREEGASNNSWRFYASYFKMALSIRFGAS